MWIEVADKLLNFDHITKVEKDSANFQIHFFTINDKITVEFKDEFELEQVLFNLLERIKSKPIDGFRHE